MVGISRPYGKCRPFARRVWFARVSEPIFVEVRRNGVVEAAHRIHAVAVRSGEVIAAAGADPQQLLRQPRGDARPLPRPRLADAGLSLARAPGPAGLPRGARAGG